MKRLIAVIATLLLFSGCTGDAGSKEGLTVRFFDVGKADAFYFECGGENMLMDAGTAKDGAEVARRLSELGVDSIDYLMVTHFDRDHAGGVPEIVQQFEVKTLLRPEYSKESEEAAACIGAAERAGADIVMINSYTELALGGATLKIHPAGKEYEKDPSNNSSLVTEVFYGENSLLFTGDIEKERIADIMDSLNSEGYDFLKVPHHGKYEKILPELFGRVGAQSALITSSEKNPEEEKTLRALSDAGTDIILTRQGEVLLTCNGREISITQ